MPYRAGADARAVPMGGVASPSGTSGQLGTLGRL
jgi:hypothetical protein